MWRTLISTTAILAAASALQPAAAQSLLAPWNAEVVAPVPPPAPVGYTLAPGTTFVPVFFSEIGYDTNPNFLPYNQQGSAFIRSGTGFNLSSVSPTTVGTLSASGSMLDYFNSDEYNGPLRFAGAASGTVTTVVQPGMTLGSNSFITYTDQDYNPSETEGTSIELGYRNDLLASIVKARFVNVQYFNSDILPASPANLNSTFDYNRFEGTWTALFGPSLFIAPYAELSAARVNYTNQPVPAIVDRSADDYHEKLGARFTLSPTLFTDLGWRLNERNTDDTRITSFQSDFFDGAVTWRPSPFFFFNASVERYIGEPSTTLAVLADVRSYTAKVTYLPVPGVTLSASGGTQNVKDIGSGVHYDFVFAGAEAAWDYNNHVQFYTTLRYQDYDIHWQYMSVDSFRVMAGIKVIPDGQDLLNGESLESLMARLADAHRPIGSEFQLSGGYSWFGLPDMKNVTIVGGTLFNQAVGEQTTSDGSLDGGRIDARLSNFATGVLPDGTLLSFGVSGFYGNYEGTTNSHCQYGLTTDCAIVNIVDANTAIPNNTGPFGDLSVTTRRNVNYYGFAVDTGFGGLVPGGLKDGPVVVPSPFRIGLAMRGIDETSHLTSIDASVCDPTTYKEILNTHYYGGFFGVQDKTLFDDGLTLGVDATAGLYYTDVSYQGHYNGYTAVIPYGYFTDTGYVNSNLDRGSFIGTVRLDLQQQLGWGAVGVFAQGEYFSYVPKMIYNNNDVASGVIWGGISGNQNGTRIGSSDAWNLTTGLSVSWYLN